MALAVVQASFLMVSGGRLLVVVQRFLVAVASLVLKHRLWAHGLQELQLKGSEAQAQ